MPPKVSSLARHVEPSFIFSLDDEPWRPSPRLLELVAQVAAEAPGAQHPILSARAGSGPRWYEVFPGEHYDLLTTLCRLIHPKTVWEFGTDTGMGTVALLEGGGETRIHTVDLEPWTNKVGPWLTADDFRSGRVTQIVADMKSPELFARHADAIAEADLMLVDGPKDGYTEPAFFELLAKVPFRHLPLIVIDDIRVMNMLAVWRGLHRPKMDITSFGHWSGTGLVDWCAPKS